MAGKGQGVGREGPSQVLKHPASGLSAALGPTPLLTSCTARISPVDRFILSILCMKYLREQKRPAELRDYGRTRPLARFP